MLISALVTFLVVILILYLINMLPIDGRAKQIARIVVIILGVISLLKYIAVFLSMIRKSGNRFSEKIMLKQKATPPPWLPCDGRSG
jgi:hypothetical protein